MGRSGDLDRRSRVPKVVLIAALGLVVALGKLCLFTVDSAEYAIVTDFGKPTQVITTPGLRVKYCCRAGSSQRFFDTIRK
jgi:membrane protease subunit HflC